MENIRKGLWTRFAETVVRVYTSISRFGRPKRKVLTDDRQILELFAHRCGFSVEETKEIADVDQLLDLYIDRFCKNDGLNWQFKPARDLAPLRHFVCSLGYDGVPWEGQQEIRAKIIARTAAEEAAVAGVNVSIDPV